MNSLGPGATSSWGPQYDQVHDVSGGVGLLGCAVLAKTRRTWAAGFCDPGDEVE